MSLENSAGEGVLKLPVRIVLLHELQKPMRIVKHQIDSTPAPFAAVQSFVGDSETDDEANSFQAGIKPRITRINAD